MTSIDKNATIMDIVSLMRDESIDHADLICFREDGSIDMTELADRIEAAAKREKAKIEADALAVGGIVEAARRREATTEKSSAVGNAAAMREALVEISKFADDWQSYANTKIGALDRIYELANATLAAPPRNCDVGTAEEQWSRFEKMCFSSRQPDDPDYCSCKCKVDGGCVNDCALIWAQMPYEAEEGGAK